MEIVDYELWEVPPRWQFLKLETSDGLVGWGEPVVETGRARATRAAVEELLDAYLLGEDPLPIEDHWQTMYKGGFYRGGPVLMSALSGIDQALWDIKGKHYGMPVYEFLGGAVRDRVRLYQHVYGDDPEELAADAREQVDAGFTALKTPVHGPLRRVDTPAAVEFERERIGALRDAVGPEIDVAIDFHGRVSKPMAKRIAVALEEFDCMFYEEPVLSEHNDALPGIAAATATPIATGERMYSRWDFKPLLEDGAVDVIQPDVSHAGGITELTKIASMAEAYDVAVAPHSPLGPVALAACVHVDVSTPNAIVQEQIVHREEVPNYLEDFGAFAHDDGYVEPLEGPGLGVDVDEDALEAAATEGTGRIPDWRHDDGSIAEW